jgi:uracil phosphoribosyltransferase
VSKPNQFVDHLYGDKVFISTNAWTTSLLAKLSLESTHLPELFWLTRRLYQESLSQMLEVVFPRQLQNFSTRMIQHNKNAVLKGEYLKPDTRVVVVDIARAGIIPAQALFEELCHYFNPQLIRQDHFYMARKMDQAGRVVGVDVSGSKIGGDIEDAIVIIPDPMGATGSSISHALDYYKSKVPGKARAFIVANLINTPEFLRKITTNHSDTFCFSHRLDRGLSAPEVLKSKPGLHWENEKGLNEHDYIVPGAGGVGELLNNSFV